MKTKTIFKTLAMAMMMPAMLLTTACSSDDDAIANNPENNNQKGYALPVTINVTRQGDAATRATYDEGTKTLSFSSGDQLFVTGTDGTAGAFAGTLEWQSGGTFSGTIYTANAYSGTADALLGSASTATATLLPAGYGSIGYLSVSGEGCNATLATDATKAFATSKADGVAQLSLEQASTYSDGFALAPQNAILNFTAVTGESGSAPASSSVSLQAGETTISGSVAPVEGDWDRALANFAIAVAGSATPSSLTLTVDGTSVSLGSHTLTAGKIYNQKCANINVMSPYIQDNEKWLVYGTGAPSGWRLSIAEGATVTLSNVYLNDYAIIAYLGNNTIILADGTTNTIAPSDGVAIDGTMADGKTLTIKGTGTLIATGGYGAPAIGIREPEFESCGAITIESTVHLTATAGTGQSKAITTGSGGGTVTIGGVVYAGGADSPIVYPAPPTLADVFTDGAVVEVKFNTAIYDEWYGVTGTYNAGTSTYSTTMSGSSGAPESVSMTKDGNNLVASSTDYNTITITFNTTANEYTVNATYFDSGWRMISLKSITINGVDITSSLTNATPAASTVTWDFTQLSGYTNIWMGYENGGVTLQGDGDLNLDNGTLMAMETCTFTAPSGKKFTSIVITVDIDAGGYAFIDGFVNDSSWTTATWSGSDTSVSFSEGEAFGITSIVFTLEDE
jgi:hypothetical protein